MNRKTALWIVMLIVVALPLAAQETQPPASPTPTPVPAAAPETAPATAPAAAASSVPHAYMEKLTVVVDGKAKANGSLKLEFLPIGGEPRVIDVNVLAKTKAKDIARDIHKELSLVAGGAYKVKLSGDEIRISKKDKSAPHISVTVTELALPGVSVHVE